MRARPLLATVLALTALTGCSDDAEPVAAVAPVPVAEATPTAEPTPVDVETPVVEAPAPTPTGPGMEWVYEQNGRFEEMEAATFAAYFVAATNYGYTYTDSGPLRSISLPSCELCMSFAEAMDVALKDGIRYEAGDNYLRTSVVTDVRPEQQEMTVEIVTRSVEGRALSADGRVLAEFPVYEHDTGNVHVRMEGGRWWITELD